MKVYEYGAQAPRTSGDVVAEQMRLAHRYYNTLVELEHRRRLEYDALMTEYDDYDALSGLATALNDDVEERRAKIRAARARVRRKVDTAVLNAEVRDLKEALAFARALTKEAKAKARELLVAPLEKLNEADLERCKAARAVCGCYWGTYLVVEDAMAAARKALAPPRFRRWDGDGHLQVQIQHGMTVAEAASCADTRFRLRLPPADSWDSRLRRRKAQGTLCQIRVTSTEAGAPVWAEVPIYMHRPLPADAVIKRVHLLRERMADRERWKVQITVDTAEVRRAPEGYGIVGVDIGWRVMPEGLRVAYAYGIPCSTEKLETNSTGTGGQLALDHDLLSALTKAESLRSIRDRMLDEMKAAVVPAVKILLAEIWGETNDPRGETGALVAWLAEVAPTLHAWRSQARFAALARKWAENRVPGDGLVFLALTSWAKNDLHLWQWEEHQRDKALRRRRELYRVWAAKMASRYAVLVIEGDEKQKSGAMDLRPLAKRPKAEEKDTSFDEARSNRFLAATSILRTCLIQAFQARGREVRFADYRRTTMRCYVCGTVESRTDALVQTCSCGTTWDQDDNAARNLVASGSVMTTAPLSLERGNGAGGRWKRLKDNKAARLAAAATVGRSQSDVQVAMAAAER